MRFHVSIQCSLLAVLEDQVEILFVNTQGRIDLHEVLVFDLTHEGLSEGVLGLVADDVGFELFGSDVDVVLAVVGFEDVGGGAITQVFFSVKSFLELLKGDRGEDLQNFVPFKHSIIKRII